MYVVFPLGLPLHLDRVSIGLPAELGVPSGSRFKNFSLKIIDQRPVTGYIFKSKIGSGHHLRRYTKLNRLLLKLSVIINCSLRFAESKQNRDLFSALYKRVQPTARKIL